MVTCEKVQDCRFVGDIVTHFTVGLVLQLQNVGC